MMPPLPADPAVIRSYHAHVYYRDAASRAVAAALRQALAERFPVELGRWRDEPVGPHPRPMYQVAFAAEHFGVIAPWLALNHGGLPVLIHPNTGDAAADHSAHAFWLGEQLPLDIEFLRHHDSA